MKTHVILFALSCFVLAVDARAECVDENGVVDPGEECDGSDLDGQTCSSVIAAGYTGTLVCESDCTFNTEDCESYCGNGARGGLEECDDGGDNSDIEPDACRTDCRLAHCGDGTRDSGEECDDYYTNNSDEMPDACRTNCVDPWCGDGVIDVGQGEQCDDGPDNGTNPGVGFCNSICVIQYCGNGIIDPGEQCDWGVPGSMEPDACRPGCQDPACGDDVVDSGEECDDGYDNSDFEPDRCRSDCSLPSCGDGVVDPSLGEDCDLGAGNANDGVSECRLDCLYAFCGNGTREGNEVCDDGNLIEDDGCTTACRPNVCGDGLLTPPDETCDGGVCDYACLRDFANCGDGTQDSLEECDAGANNSNEPDAPCRIDCWLPRCGDGIVDSGEECDRGPLCAPDCTRLRLP